MLPKTATTMESSNTRRRSSIPLASMTGCMRTIPRKTWSTMRSPRRPEPVSPSLYHGYYFRVMKSQGPEATGGALDYVVKGNMIGGVALVAWPAEYGVSGIQTFIVNHEGIVYGKDLGSNTAALARQMTRFNPYKSWKRNDLEQEESRTKNDGGGPLAPPPSFFCSAASITVC